MSTARYGRAGRLATADTFLTYDRRNTMQDLTTIDVQI